MSPIHRLPIFAMFTLLAGWASTPMVAESQPVPPKTAEEEMATIYFFRPISPPEGVVGLLSLDDMEMGTVSVCQYAVIRAKPGHHELKLSFPIWAGVSDQSVSVEFERNKNYYFSYTPLVGATGPLPAAGMAAPAAAPEIKSVTETDAKSFLTNYERAFICGELPTADVSRATGKPSDRPILLDPVYITESTQLSFQFSIQVIREQPTNRLISMSVDRVLEGSDAQEVGLLPGAKIVAIEGKPVEQYEATFRNGSELAKILVDRREGDQVTLAVIDPGETKPRKIVVTRRRLIWR